MGLVAAATRAGIAMIVLALIPARAGAQCGGFCIYEVASPEMFNSYAGAGASAQTAATAYLNPAGMTLLDGFHGLVGGVGSWVNSELDLDRKRTVPAGERTGSGRLGGFVPFGGAYGVAQPFAKVEGLDRLRLGFALNNLYGGKLSYDDDWVGKNYLTDIRFFGLNFEPAAAYQLTDWLSLGAGLHVLYYHLDFTSALIEVSGADDWATSFTLGGLLKPRDDTRIGLTYRYRFDVNLGDSYVTRILPNMPTKGFASSFELPQGVNVSLYHDLGDRWALLGDAGWSDWSVFSGQSSQYDLPRIPNQAPPKPPVRTVAGTRNWHDTWRIGAGVQYRVLDSVLLQGGFSFDSSPLPASNRLPDIPAGDTYRFSLGVQWETKWEPATLRLGMGCTVLWVPDARVDRVRLPLPDGFPKTVIAGTYQPDNAILMGLTLAIAL